MKPSKVPSSAPQDWRPSASLETLRARADFFERVRRFFRARDVLEVDTPLLSEAATADEAIQPFWVFSKMAPNCTTPQTKARFLCTSPEYFMKRLLCAGAGPIYQITKCFRAEELGRLHNPEFTMLEWYRVAYEVHQLQQEVLDLVAELLPSALPPRYVRYTELFQEHLGIDPLEVEKSKLLELSHAFSWCPASESPPTRTELLQFLFAAGVEPKLCEEEATVITHFPVEQAALAEIDGEDPRVCSRFEVYLKGIELANGFQELQDARVLKARFESENLRLVEKGLTPRPLDQRLLEAQMHGLPRCAGVALGLDRLFMMARGFTAIQPALTFSFERS